jgi:hypothetical protein
MEANDPGQQNPGPRSRTIELLLTGVMLVAATLFIKLYNDGGFVWGIWFFFLVVGLPIAVLFYRAPKKTPPEWTQSGGKYWPVWTALYLLWGSTTLIAVTMQSLEEGWSWLRILGAIGGAGIIISQVQKIARRRRESHPAEHS